MKEITNYELQSTKRGAARRGWARLGMAVIVCQCVLCVGCLLNGGCTMINPGGQTAAALGQRKLIQWKADGTLIVDARGPQTERFTMAQGSIVLRENPETGELEIDPEKSRLEYFLTGDPSATDARDASIVYAGESTKQVSAAMGAIRDLTQAIAAVLPAIVTRPVEPPDEGGSADGG